ncbi:mechanosensitive ion channel family protein [Bacteroidota bacterium]
MQNLLDKLYNYWTHIGLSEQIANNINVFLLIFGIILLAWLAGFVTKKILISFITRLIKKTKTDWDDLLLKRKVFTRFSHLAPAIVVYYFIVFKESSQIVGFIQSVTIIYMIIIGLIVIDSIINTLNDIYDKLPWAKNRPIKGYVQIVKIFIYFIAIISVLSILLNKSPSKLIAGLGALAAVLLLVFKDTILGFTASIQLSANNMVNIGDWIEMPSRKADGTVFEITLNTVKVQNWDKTISTIPTYALISESFQNWKGMEESGGRRIKRSINIDMRSVKFINEELLEKLKKIQLIKPYLQQKIEELNEFNRINNIDDSSLVNGRRITNIGTFRKYIEEYLKQHPKIHNNMTFLVRHLQPTEKGLPIQIYVFSNDQAWANYESIQADIFDHILAITQEFELKVFQNPTGEDFQQLIN